MQNLLPALKLKSQDVHFLRFSSCRTSANQMQLLRTLSLKSVTHRNGAIRTAAGVNTQSPDTKGPPGIQSSVKPQLQPYYPDMCWDPGCVSAYFFNLLDDSLC